MGYYGSVVRRNLAFAAAALSFLVLLGLLIWQGSFRIQYSPSDRSETVVVWAVSTVIFLLTVLMAFMLFRAGVKTYIDRQRNREGSRIRSKLLVGALVWWAFSRRQSGTPRTDIQERMVYRLAHRKGGRFTLDDLRAASPLTDEQARAVTARLLDLGRLTRDGDTFRLP